MKEVHSKKELGGTSVRVPEQGGIGWGGRKTNTKQRGINGLSGGASLPEGGGGEK